jgi:hypothetical protein
MRSLLWLAMACVSFEGAAVSDEDAASALKPANGMPWSTMSVRVVDDGGIPIPKATVRPWALRAGNGHGQWNEEIGAPRTVQANAEGIAIITYPKSYGWTRTEERAVTQVSVIVKHPEFVGRNMHMNVTDDPAIVQDVALPKGVRLQIAGVEPGTDKPLDHCFLVIENSETGEHEFTREPDGWLMSFPIRESRKWFRVIQAEPGQPARFSKPVAWTPEDPTSKVQRVELRAGTRVLGRVSDNVPRPIKRGRVVAWCGSPVRNDAKPGDGGRSRPIFWIETASIRPDGSFEFPSLPTGYMAQFYAIANDMISAQPSDKAFAACCQWFSDEAKRNQVFRYGQPYKLAGGKTELTIDMEPAGQVRVKCLDPDGKPLPGMIVSSWPNQYMVGGGSTIFCSRLSSLESLQNPKKRRDLDESSIYSVKAGEDGIALLRNLPQGNQHLVAGGRRWATNRDTNVMIDVNVPADVSLTLMRVE